MNLIHNRKRQQSGITMEPEKSSLFSRLGAGVIGGLVLGTLAGSLLGIALIDPLKGEDIVIGAAVLLTQITIVINSLIFAARSERTALIWRKLIMRSSTFAFAIPIAVIFAFIRLSILHDHMSMGPIIYLFIGIMGIVGGTILRFVGMHIPLTTIYPTKTHKDFTPAQQKATATPICPACGSKLIQMVHNELTLDVCDNGCGGIWFDNYELHKAIESVPCVDADSSLKITANNKIHGNPNQKRPCPKCNGILMLRHLFNNICRIEIDECPSCGGIWLDHGEFEHIQASLDHKDECIPASPTNPEAAVLMAGFEAEMKKSRQGNLSRLNLCKFIGTRYHTGQL